METSPTEREAPRLSAADAAWIGVVPAALLLLVALLWLAPPLSDLLYPAPSLHFLGSLAPAVHPEPEEGTRYLLAIAAPFLLCGGLLWLARNQGRGTWTGAASAVIAVQLAVLAFVIVNVVKQSDAPVYAAPQLGLDPAILGARYWVTGLVLGGISFALIAGGWHERFAGRWARIDQLAQRRGLLLGIAIAVTALWLLPAIQTEQSIAGGHPLLRAHLPLIYDEYAAAINGRTPLVDFIPIYNNLLPVATEPAFWVFGNTISTFTVLMVALSTGALLAVYGMLENATGRRAVALGLYVAVLGIALFPYIETASDRLYEGNAFGNLPARYLGPLVVGWLVARRLRRGAPTVSAIFFVAGLSTLNNSEFGLGCIAAAAAALWLGSEGGVPDRRRTLALAGQAALGLVAALVVVSVVTLIRSGSMPHLGLLFYFAKIFGREGYALLPMPELGLHIVLYLTFTAALLTAVVRAVHAGTDRAMTGTLAYAGAFGLFAGVYYAGESEPSRIIALFPVWGLAIALLAAVAVPALDAAREDRAALRRVALPSLAVLVGVGLMASTVVRFPAPWHQIDRIGMNGPEPFDTRPAARFVEAQTEPNDSVLLLSSLGHRVAEQAGVDDVFPFNDPGNVKTFEQLDRALKELSDAGGGPIFTQAAVLREIPAYLGLRGFAVVATDPVTGLSEWQPVSAGP